ncbi:MAG: TIGR00645 family protein [Bradyrhizobium sp.]|uniref:TIGR00645 family protein n=1 Tax=Bradyrhizobium TaxID=374 RepID=UPI0004625F84|nr:MULTISPECIES: TIGR00645 family protein [Bradyrhizobium]KQT27562.1 hypothetical protein ASG57_18620 [Bradyrhizobium sp. Leaf396]
MTSEPKAPLAQPVPPRLGLLAQLIFGSRWLQFPLYIGLIVAQGVYVLLFLKELWHLVAHSFEATEQQIMLVVLGLIDVVMISNLLIMVIVGGYETFVSRLNLTGHPDEPEWLSHVNASVLKIKLAMAIIGISSISLLRTFIEAGNLGTARANFTESAVMWQVLIHMTFIVSAIGIAWVDRLSDSGHRQEAGHH